MPFGGLAFLGTVIPGQWPLYPSSEVIPNSLSLLLLLPGLLIGAMISKNIANFLEENELFVPSDDDDDED